MTKINFNSNEFTPLSKDVKEAMKIAVDDFANANPNGFGDDYKVEAEKEEIRGVVGDVFKANNYQLFFTNGVSNSYIELINLCILQLDIKLVISSVFENKAKLNYLRQLEKAGKIKLHFLKTSDFGEIDLEDLKQILEESESKTLISFSHANRFTGVLLPVKDITAIAKQYNAFFHLDSILVIGKYEIDLSRIEVDFLSLEANQINGPVGVGCLFMNEKLAISDEQFSQMKRIFESIENRSVILISGLKIALISAFEQVKDVQKNISELKSYFISELENRLQLKTLDQYLKKKGLFNQSAFFVPKEKFGKYLIENLDLNGFIVSKEKYPFVLNDFPESHFINISLSVLSTKEEVDIFLNFMQKVVQF